MRKKQKYSINKEYNLIYVFDNSNVIILLIEFINLEISEGRKKIVGGTTGKNKKRVTRGLSKTSR